MLTKKVVDICTAHFKNCSCNGCPLLRVCEIPNPEMPGATIRDKTEWWENMMNKAAEEAMA